MAYFYGEDYFVRALGTAGYAAIAGTTTTEMRRDRIRQAIIDTGRVNEALPAKAGRVETFSQLWQRFYGLPFYNDEDQPKPETCNDEVA